MVYTTKLQTLEELRDQIEHAINDIPLTIQTVSHSVQRHYWVCTVAEGRQFEHVRAQGSLRNRTH